jgi:ribosomal protein S18 acetylase RimI-like enzyme
LILKEYKVLEKEAIMPLVIRQATPADAPVVVEFNRRLAKESENKDLALGPLAAGVAAGLADPRKALYFLAEENGAVLGQIMITTEWSDWRNGWFWWIQSVYVKPEARRRGVFRALFEHVHRTALQDSEVIGLRLYVDRENLSAQQTYSRLGMQPTSYLVFERFPLNGHSPVRLDQTKKAPTPKASVISPSVMKGKPADR